jgi:4-coumarate--CoA ligase
MTVFKSQHPDITIPRDITIWHWLFDPASPSSPLSKHPSNQQKLAGFQNALTKERLDWSEVARHATHMSSALVRKHGLKPGDTVALFSANTIWYPVAMFAVLRAGGVVSGASPAYNVEEMTYALRTAKAKFLMTTPSSMAVAVAAAKQAGIPGERVFLLEGYAEGFGTLQELSSVGNKFGEDQVEPFRIPRGKTNFEICGFLSFSSGTTGLPKAVSRAREFIIEVEIEVFDGSRECLSIADLNSPRFFQVMIAHRNVIAQCLQIQQITPENHKKVLSVLPLFHSKQSNSIPKVISSGSSQVNKS